MTPTLQTTLYRVLAALLLNAVTALANAAVQCTASTSGVNFGAYNPLAGSALSSSGTINVNCQLTGGVADTAAYTVSLSPGSSASYVTRVMRSGVNSLNYNLYRDSTNTQVWGDGSAGTGVASGSLFVWIFAPTRSASLAVYATIPLGQANVVPGNYNDPLLVTVTF